VRTLHRRGHDDGTPMILSDGLEVYKTCRVKGSSQHSISDIDISSRSSFKVRTARPAAERPILSLNIDREIGLYPSFTYLERSRDETGTAGECGLVF
jgi:hypothetical protein